MKDRSWSSLEEAKQKRAMSQSVAQKNKFPPFYANYAGASLQDADKSSKLDFLIDTKVFGDDFTAILKWIRKYEDYRRAAFFASTANEVTKLGFMLGAPKRGKIRVT